MKQGQLFAIEQARARRAGALLVHGVMCQCGHESDDHEPWGPFTYETGCCLCNCLDFAVLLGQ